MISAAIAEHDVAMLTAGARAGPYEILDKLGEGGMGVIYRAADTKLGRQVALKILPASVTADPDRLTRFDREARTLASLNHPNIAQIYGIEALPDGAQSALVMELVEGEDLAQRIARGPLPVDEALPIARQIADALSAAHEQRIVHRDLKPANIRIRHDGAVKVLDFGLAKVAAIESEAATNSIALTSPVMVTSVGTIVGTAAYMSPEQARGRTVDRRADVWAFGCVLFEMLTGRRPFDGGSVSEVVAALMRDAPAFEALPPGVPTSVRRLLRRCLEKDPARRLDSMRDACLEIDEPHESATLNQTTVRPRRFMVALGGGALAAVVGLAIAAYLFGRSSNTTPVAPLNAELSLIPAESLGPHSLFDRPARPAFAIASDGSRIVFTGVSGETTQLYARSLDEPQARAIPGTNGAETPFVSPDNQWVGFLADGVIRKVPLAGGPVVAIADLKSTDGGTRSPLVRPGADFFGASWGEDDAIVFGRYTDGLWQVSTSGGTPSRLTTAVNGWHRLPHHLPRRRGVLLTVSEPRRAVALLTPGATEPRRLIESAADGRYVETGHILYASADGLLMAVPFDLDRLAVTGASFAVEENVMVADGSGAPAANSSAAQFDVARSGTLVFATGGSFQVAPSRLVWADRSGRMEPISTSAAGFSRPQLSPDGRRIAVTVRPESSRGEPAGIAVIDLDRNSFSQLTRSREWGPLWSADGSQVLFMQQDGMGRVRADGSAPIERLHNGIAYPQTVTPDRTTLLFGMTSPDSGSDIWTMRLEGDHTARPLLNSPANEAWAALSPDGKWLAYGSDSSGRFEVYVQSFPDLGPRQQITVEGGDSPLWSRNGRELFFRTAGAGVARITAVDAMPGPNGITFGKPHRLFEGRFGFTGSPTAYDVSPDGSRFLMTETLDPPKQPVTRLHIVLNWFEVLRRAQRLSK